MESKRVFLWLRWISSSWPTFLPSTVHGGLEDYFYIFLDLQSVNVFFQVAVDAIVVSLGFFSFVEVSHVFCWKFLY